MNGRKLDILPRLEAVLVVPREHDCVQRACAVRACVARTVLCIVRATNIPHDEKISVPESIDSV